MKRKNYEKKERKPNTKNQQKYTEKKHTTLKRKLLNS